ncbi:hypothetical protein LTR78_009340 [Recurvomyces mirabilis]|uniref:Uncharacterized protein n=1 Tax=Recurvomyces mirabilis TaxID=574656 RepID=A0AAE0TNL9_9PEZI|nr:hypothetical protein LTR78_009340 [Recurvomyces mirabilis]
MAQPASELLPDTEEGHSAPVLSTDIADLPLDARCNRPFEDNYLSDRSYTFFTHIATDLTIEKRMYVTSFFITKDFVQRFWPAAGDTVVSSRQHPEIDVDIPGPAVLNRSQTNPQVPNNVALPAFSSSNDNADANTLSLPEILITQSSSSDDALPTTTNDNASTEMPNPLAADSSTRRQHQGSVQRRLLPRGTSTALVRRRDDVEDDLEGYGRAVRPPSSVYSEHNDVDDVIYDTVSQVLTSLEQNQCAWAVLGIEPEIRFGSGGKDLEELLNDHAFQKQYTVLEARPTSKDALAATNTANPYKVYLVSPKPPAFITGSTLHRVPPLCISMLGFPRGTLVLYLEPTGDASKRRITVVDSRTGTVFEAVVCGTTTVYNETMEFPDRLSGEVQVTFTGLDGEKNSQSLPSETLTFVSLERLWLMRMRYAGVHYQEDL